MDTRSNGIEVARAHFSTKAYTESVLRQEIESLNRTVVGGADATKASAPPSSLIPGARVDRRFAIKEKRTQSGRAIQVKPGLRRAEDGVGYFQIKNMDCLIDNVSQYCHLTGSFAERSAHTHPHRRRPLRRRSQVTRGLLK